LLLIFLMINCTNNVTPPVDTPDDHVIPDDHVFAELAKSNSWKYKYDNINVPVNYHYAGNLSLTIINDTIIGDSMLYIIEAVDSANDFSSTTYDYDTTFDTSYVLEIADTLVKYKGSFSSKYYYHSFFALTYNSFEKYAITSRFVTIANDTFPIYQDSSYNYCHKYCNKVGLIQSWSSINPVRESFSIQLIAFNGQPIQISP
jgi:hypothetical protein